MFYTSNFARNGKHPQAVAISASVPPGWKGRRLKELAPPMSMVQEYKRKFIGEEVYRYKYAYQLSTLNVHKIAAQLNECDVLLCWCAKGAFCHRTLVAKWLTANGYPTVEL